MPLRYINDDGKEVGLINFDNPRLEDIPCACHCGRMVQRTSINDKYATMGCADREKNKKMLIARKRREERRKNGRHKSV